MPRQPPDVHRKIRGILTHTDPAPVESDRAIDHFEHASTESLGLVKYVDDHLPYESMYAGVYNRHTAHLRRLALGSLIQAFDRFLKELAVACVDALARYANDDRFDEFKLQGNAVATQFAGGQSVGKIMCEGETWVSNKVISDRFSKLLKSPFGEQGWERLFPERNQNPPAERPAARTLAILWQIRHNLAHNVGLLTDSDAAKLRLLLAGDVAIASRLMLSPKVADLRHAKTFLLALARAVNRRVGDRLAVVLTEFHRDDPTLFAAQEMADRVSRDFGYPLTVAGAVGVI